MSQISFAQRSPVPIAFCPDSGSKAFAGTINARCAETTGLSLSVNNPSMRPKLIKWWSPDIHWWILSSGFSTSYRWSLTAMCSATTVRFLKKIKNSNLDYLHNLGGKFDNVLVFRELFMEGLIPQIIRKGNKLYELKVKQRKGHNPNVIFRDSYNLIPTSLASLVIFSRKNDLELLHNSRSLLLAFKWRISPFSPTWRIALKTTAEEFCFLRRIFWLPG